MGGTVNMGGKVLYTVIHLYNSCTQYSTTLTYIVNLLYYYYKYITLSSTHDGYFCLNKYYFIACFYYFVRDTHVLMVLKILLIFLFFLVLHKTLT